MYRHGHTGVGLLLYASVGYVALTTGRPAFAIGGFAVMIWLAMLPDIDMRVPLVSHRGPTHTLAFAAIVGFACGTAGWRSISGIGVTTTEKGLYTLHG